MQYITGALPRKTQKESYRGKQMAPKYFSELNVIKNYSVFYIARVFISLGLITTYRETRIAYLPLVFNRNTIMVFIRKYGKHCIL